MDIGRVLTRSIEIGWRYRVLWVLAFIFVLFGGGGGGNISPASGSGYRFGGQPGTTPFLNPQTEEPIIAIVGFIICLGLIWFLLSFYFRFVARGALVAAVRSIENGQSPTVSSAWSEGQRYWGRLLGLGLLVGIPLALVSILLVVVALLPLLAWIIPVSSQTGGIPPGPSSQILGPILGTVFLFCCAILCVVLIQIAIHPIYQFAVRAIVLEEKGTGEGLALGWTRVRDNLGSVILLYLALIGARILWGIALTIVAIPVALVLGAALVGPAQQSVTSAIIIALVLALPIGLVFVFLEGLFQVFEQNVWTEGYLALLPRAPAAPAAPAPTAPPL